MTEEIKQNNEPVRKKTRTEKVVAIISYVVGVMSLGAFYGLSGYLFFGHDYAGRFRGQHDLMTLSFLLGVPLCVGLIVGYFISRRRKTSYLGTVYTAGSLMSFLVFLSGAFLGEGIICILMAFPLVILAVVVGAIIGRLSSKLAKRALGKKLSIIVMAPFLLVFGEQQLPVPNDIRVIDRSIHIAAPADMIWHHINYPTDIQPEELSQGVAYRIGVPYPIEARTLTPKKGGFRELKWQRGVTFKEEITAWEENRYIQWKYLFNADSFPSGSLDDHIKIGGKYFDLVDTSYRLTPEKTGTRLDIRVTYRISTTFNWYAEQWADFLLADAASAILNFYKNRSENPQA